MLLTRADKLLIGILILAAACGIGLHLTLLSSGGEQEAQIYKEGNLIQTIRLRPGYKEELRLGGNEKYNVIVAENGKIEISDADCPDQICVRTGWVSVAPQQIVCLPYRVIVKIVSSKPADIDGIAR